MEASKRQVRDAFKRERREHNKELHQRLKEKSLFVAAPRIAKPQPEGPTHPLMNWYLKEQKLCGDVKVAAGALYRFVEGMDLVGYDAASKTAWTDKHSFVLDPALRDSYFVHHDYSLFFSSLAAPPADTCI